jgi:hypothetical protein
MSDLQRAERSPTNRLGKWREEGMTVSVPVCVEHEACHTRFLALNEIETPEPTQTTLDGREEPILAPPAPESHETESLFSAGAFAGIRGQLAITDREGT